MKLRHNFFITSAVLTTLGLLGSGASGLAGEPIIFSTPSKELSGKESEEEKPTKEVEGVASRFSDDPVFTAPVTGGGSPSASQGGSSRMSTEKLQEWIQRKKNWIFMDVFDSEDSGSVQDIFRQEAERWAGMEGPSDAETQYIFDQAGFNDRMSQGTNTTQGTSQSDSYGWGSSDQQGNSDQSDSSWSQLFQNDQDSTSRGSGGTSPMQPFSRGAADPWAPLTQSERARGGGLGGMNAPFSSGSAATTGRLGPRDSIRSVGVQPFAEDEGGSSLFGNGGRSGRLFGSDESSDNTLIDFSPGSGQGERSSLTENTDTSSSPFGRSMNGAAGTSLSGASPSMFDSSGQGEENSLNGISPGSQRTSGSSRGPSPSYSAPTVLEMPSRGF